MGVIVYLQLPIQSVHIIIKAVSSNPAYGEMYPKQLQVIQYVGDLWQVGGFLRVLWFLPTQPTAKI